MTVEEAVVVLDKILNLHPPLPEGPAWQTLKAAVLAQQTHNTASLPCLCEDCTRRTLGSCRPNTNSRVTACEGYTKSQQAVA